jgi:hypothetical protein
MVGLSVKKFAGSVPTTGDRALAEGFAVESVNTWLYAKELRGIRPPVELLTINPGIDKVFRIPRGTPGGDPAWPGIVPPASHLIDSTWKSLDHPDTDVVKGVLINDSFDRWYFCSPQTNLMLNTTDRLETSATDYIAGVEGPGAAVTIGGTSGTNVSRAYVYTYQTIYGEESAPSPAKVGAFDPAQPWLIGNLPSAPAAVAGYVPLKYLILYRTITSSSGLATYFQVKKFEIGVDVIPDPYSDTLADTVLASNLQLQTIGWLPPPRFKAGDPTATPPTVDQLGLQGIVAMPNGFLVGWAGSDIYMSVPYQPHAWPIEYIVSTEFPIVGLGVIGNSCIICTQGYPSVLTGVEPASTMLTKINTTEPCLSRGGIVSTINGVYYPSQNGLIGVRPSGLQNITETLITREQWITDFSPEYLRAVRFQNGYLAVRAVNDVSKRSAFYIDPSQLEVALTELTDFDNCVNVVADVWSGEVFMLRDEKVWRWDPPSDDLVPLRWKSKEYQLPYEVNLGAYAVYWDHDRFSDLDINLDIIDEGVPVRILVWCNRRLVYDQNVPINRNGKQMRLPSGFVGDIWQFEIRARAPVYSFIIAQTPRELRGD